MKTVSSILLLISAFCLSVISCKDDENYDTIESVDKVKIDSVKVVSDTMSVFSVQSIRTYSTYSSKCQGFYGYDYIYASDIQRDVTAYQYFRTGDCVKKPVVIPSQINFSPQKKGVYTFRFWSGNNTWITKNIVVN
ncbi:hypothetical protein [Chryseobacterium sp. RR2-3-20]|uniref:hypothetical protein n=1 Tax=Chryseobacterium sp. RR2-3-20 TaxID=2787626 RepID=UPI001ADFD3AA|nr:hypothetical protein [Chryseobacterium sp. RR2-3-20]